MSNLVIVVAITVAFWAGVVTGFFVAAWGAREVIRDKVKEAMRSKSE